MRNRHKGKKSKDTCSCWACRDEKYRETRKTETKRAISEELIKYIGYLEAKLNEYDKQWQHKIKLK